MKAKGGRKIFVLGPLTKTPTVTPTSSPAKSIGTASSSTQVSRMLKTPMGTPGGTPSKASGSSSTLQKKVEYASDTSDTGDEGDGSGTSDDSDDEGESSSEEEPLGKGKGRAVSGALSSGIHALTNVFRYRLTRGLRSKRRTRWDRALTATSSLQVPPRLQCPRLRASLRRGSSALER